MYFNYQRMIKELYELLESSDEKYHNTIRIMIDESVYHFLKEHNVPFDKQAKFLTTMFEKECPRVIAEYKLKKLIDG